MNSEPGSGSFECSGFFNFIGYVFLPARYA